MPRYPPSKRQIQALKFLRKAAGLDWNLPMNSKKTQTEEHYEKMTIFKLEAEILVLKAEIVKLKVKCESAENDLKILLAPQEMWQETEKDEDDFWKF